MQFPWLKTQTSNIFPTGLNTLLTILLSRAASPRWASLQGCLLPDPPAPFAEEGCSESPFLLASLRGLSADSQPPIAAENTDKDKSVERSSFNCLSPTCHVRAAHNLCWPFCKTTLLYKLPKLFKPTDALKRRKSRIVWVRQLPKSVANEFF